MINVTSKLQLNNYLKESRILIDFFTLDCGPCRLLEKELELLQESKKDLLILRVDVNACLELAKEFKIDSVPTLIYIKDGVELKRMNGFQSNIILERILNIYE